MFRTQFSMHQGESYAVPVTRGPSFCKKFKKEPEDSTIIIVCGNFILGK